MSYDFQTSLPAYNEAKQTITKTRDMVLATIELTCSVTTDGRVCDQDLAVALDWPINRITPRRNELLQAGKIQSAGKHKHPVTNRLVNYYKLAA